MRHLLDRTKIYFISHEAIIIKIVCNVLQAIYAFGKYNINALIGALV